MLRALEQLRDGDSKNDGGVGDSIIIRTTSLLLTRLEVGLCLLLTYAFETFRVVNSTVLGTGLPLFLGGGQRFLCCLN